MKISFARCQVCVCICTHTIRLHHQDEPMHIDRRASLSPPTLYHISRLAWPRNSILVFNIFTNSNALQHLMAQSCKLYVYIPWPTVPDPCGISNKSLRWKLRLALEIVRGFPSMKFKANKTLSLNMPLERHSLDTIKTVKLDVRQNLQRQAAGRMVYGCGIPGYHMCVVYPQSISIISSFHTHTHTINLSSRAMQKRNSMHCMPGHMDPKDVFFLLVGPTCWCFNHFLLFVCII